MQFKQYPSYKNSGVEWLGEVPEHWNLKRFCYLFAENKKKNIGLKETNVLSLSYGNIKEKKIDDNKGLLPESFETYQIIEPNDIVFRFTDLQNDKRSLRSAISKYHGIITSAYIAVKTKQNADFYNYLFRAYDLQKVFYSMGEGMRQSLKMDELNKMPVVLLSEDEQKRIVAFLDTETTRIDNLIAKQEKLIELLEEQRKSIISHAVTKGLNPNAPMKDSGVEWLGEVPEDWEVKRFGYIFTENKKKNIGLIETNVLSLSYGNIKEKNIDDNKGLLPESFETYQIIEPNDIVFRFTDLQNDKRSLRNAISKYHGIITSAYIGVKTKENADFYNYLFRAYDLQKVFYSMGDGMRQSLKMDELNKMPIVLPKIEAQERIVKFINEENQRINNLVVKQKNLIEKLKEYRSSIISHAVTGKIDVREFGT